MPTKRRLSKRRQTTTTTDTVLAALRAGEELEVSRETGAALRDLVYLARPCPLTEGERSRALAVLGQCVALPEWGRGPSPAEEMTDSD